MGITLGVLLAFICATAYPPAAPAQVTLTAAPSVNFGSVNVCPAGATAPAPCSSTQTLSYTVEKGTIVGGVSILTLGAPNLDFNAEAADTSTTLCKAKTYAHKRTCTVDVTFAPLAPGQRRGAVEILGGSSGSVLATTYIYGVGTGPAIAYSPSAQAVIDSSSVFMLSGVAVDASGNVFEADPSTPPFGDYELIELFAGGKPFPGYRTIAGNSITSPSAVALDGAGNLFVAGLASGDLFEIPAAGGYSTANELFFVGYFDAPSGVAVDESGNLFLVDSLRVFEVPAAGGYTTANPLASSFTFGSPVGVALDSSDNLFVADSGNKEVYEIAAAGGYKTVTTVGGGFTAPQGVAVDASGNVFVTDGGLVRELLVANNYQAVSLGSGFEAPHGIALDGSGNVYVADPGTHTIQELQRSRSPSLSFATTTVGSDSSDSPQSVLFENIGNQALTGSGVLSDSTDFTIVAGPDVVPDCTPETLSLAPGAECNLSIDFTPQSAGPLSSILTLTDNALNASAAPQNTQTVSLSGTGVARPLGQVSATLLNYGNIGFGGTKTLPLTVTNIGGGTLTIAPSINGQSYTITGSTCAAGVTAGNSCTLHVEFSPVKAIPHNDILTLQTNGAANPTVNLQGVALGVSVGTELLQFGTIPFGSSEVLTVTITNSAASGTVAIGATVTGRPNYKILTTVQNTCQAGLPAGQSCALPIEFDPVAVGVYDNFLNLTISADGPPTAFVRLDGAAD